MWVGIGIRDKKKVIGVGVRKFMFTCVYRGWEYGKGRRLLGSA